MGSMRSTTRILVTHQLQYLPQADVILVLEGGRVSARGSYAQLLDQGIDLHSFEQSAGQPGRAGIVSLPACTASWLPLVV